VQFVLVGGVALQLDGVSGAEIQRHAVPEFHPVSARVPHRSRKVGSTSLAWRFWARWASGGARWRGTFGPGLTRTKRVTPDPIAQSAAGTAAMTGMPDGASWANCAATVAARPSDVA
jgi:hypothetical protein